MKKPLLISVLATFAFPATAQTTSAPTQTVTKGALQTEQRHDQAFIQRQHEQIAGPTRQMQDLKAQLDGLQREDEDAAATDQAGERVNRAAKQKYGVRVRR